MNSLQHAAFAEDYPGVHEHDPAEAVYVAATPLEHRKSYGQFFTPQPIADLMASWVMEMSPSVVLDPAVGTGALTRACLRADDNVRITAFDTDKHVLQYADFLGRAVDLRQADYLRSDIHELFEGVIMNPPYIRHREFRDYADVRQRLSVASRFVIPKSANMYIYFCIKAILQLRPGFRGSLLIPTEWMNSNFADTFKDFLLSNKYLKEVVLFSGCTTVFEDALTTASVLLVES